MDGYSIFCIQLITRIMHLQKKMFNQNFQI